MIYTIYRRWTPDNRSYIGCTTLTLEQRAGRNGEHYKGSTTFWEAIQRTGWEAIQSEILAQTDCKQEAIELECYYIEAYKATNPEFGYNRVRAGTTYDERLITIRRSWKASDEQRAILSRKLREHLAQPGAKDYMYGDNNVSRRPEVRAEIGTKVRAYRAKLEVKERYSKQRSVTVQISKNIDGRVLIKQVRPEVLDQYLQDGWQKGWPTRQWIHRFENGRCLKKMVLRTELASYLAAGYLPGSGPRQTVRSESHRAAIGQAHSGRRHVYRIVNDSVERAKIPAADVTTYLAEGWQLGLGPRNRNI